MKASLALSLALQFMMVVDYSVALSTGSVRNTPQKPRVSSKLQQRTKRRKIQSSSSSEEKKKCEVCPDPELDLEMDRREASFALLGQLLATGVGASALFSSPESSEAVYGSDANIAMPNVIEGANYQ
mmetsp:Transcript_19476/g.28432  ORF Transcript_19476/g.28432 Transcript_19476/m.28432 type:complete len:127 (-) Transcript_19476:278-658(-)